MAHITRSNYQTLLPTIREQIKNASFVCFDAEFSGLRMPSGERSTSLFDNGPLRYSKLREVVMHNSAPQMGFCIVTRDSDPAINKYYVQCYMAYVMESSFADFRCQEKAMLLSYKSGKFLRQCLFDFNSFTKDSVPCLNENGVKALEEYVRKHPDFMKTEDRFFDEILFPKVQDFCEEGDIKDLVKRLKGLGEIADAIREYKIPVVGHNMALDLLYFLKMLGCDLPESYDEFKIVVKKFLPHVYDTKFMVGACRRNFSHHTLKMRKDDKDKLKLSGLYIAYYMTSCAVSKFAPDVTLDPHSSHFKASLISGKSCNLEDIMDTLIHNPAFDACLTALIFLNLAILSAKVEKRFDQRTVPPTMTETFLNFAAWKGQVFLARAAVKAINLYGDDPRPGNSRPRWVIVDFKRVASQISSSELKSQLENYGPVDEQKIDVNESRFATTNYKTFLKIRDHLKRLRIKYIEEDINFGDIGDSPNIAEPVIESRTDKYYDMTVKPRYRR